MRAEVLHHCLHGFAGSLSTALLACALGCGEGGGSTSSTGAGGAGPGYAHRGDFLTIPECPQGTTGYVNADGATRQACRAAIERRGYTHHYVSITSDQRDFFSDVSSFEARLKELVDAGIEPVVFLTSDSGSWKDKSLAAIKSDLSAFIPKIDGLASSYVLGIEIDEYWSASEANEIGEHLHTLTRKEVAAHQLAGKWSYCKDYGWCDYMVLQYGFGKTPEQIAAMTREAIAALGKPVVAGEYNITGSENTSRSLGNAALSAGAAGFGNGAGQITALTSLQPIEASNVQPYVDQSFTIPYFAAIALSDADETISSDLPPGVRPAPEQGAPFDDPPAPAVPLPPFAVGLTAAALVSLGYRASRRGTSRPFSRRSKRR